MAVWSEVRYARLPSDLRMDSEYYQPVYLAQEEKISALDSVQLSDVADVSDGNHLSISDQFTDAGVRYLRGQDLSDFFISDNHPAYIPYEAYHKLKRSHMKEGDILLSIVGTIGSVSIVTADYSHLTGSCKIAILRPHSVNNYFLAAYLASHIGQAQLARRIRGAVQQGLILPDLKSFPVPNIKDKHAREIEGLLKDSRQRQRDSENLYDEAENVLLAELGIDSLDLSNELSYERNYSVVQKNERFDAEHYQPKYYRVLDALKKLKHQQLLPLEKLLGTITNGHTPLRHNLGEGEVPFLTAEHVLDFRINYDSEKRILLDHHEQELKRTRLEEDDILVTIKGRIGNAAVVERLPGPVNINQDVALLRLSAPYHPYYVAGFINSVAGKALVEQISTGQINPFIGLGNLRRVLIPVFSQERMDELGELVKSKVNEARHESEESERLLEEAKRRVEKMILKGEA